MDTFNKNHVNFLKWYNGEVNLHETFDTMKLDFIEYRPKFTMSYNHLFKRLSESPFIQHLFIYSKDEFNAFFVSDHLKIISIYAPFLNNITKMKCSQLEFLELQDDFLKSISNINCPKLLEIKIDNAFSPVYETLLESSKTFENLYLCMANYPLNQQIKCDHLDIRFFNYSSSDQITSWKLPHVNRLTLRSLCHYKPSEQIMNITVESRSIKKLYIENIHLLHLKLPHVDFIEIVNYQNPNWGTFETPHLKELTLINCPLLKNLPLFKGVVKVNIENCSKALKYSLMKMRPSQTLKNMFNSPRDYRKTRKTLPKQNVIMEVDENKSLGGGQRRKRRR